MLDLSGTEKPEQIRENLIAYMRQFDGLSGVHVHDAEVVWIVTGDDPPGNYVLRTQFDQATVYEEIEATFEAISHLHDRVDWWTFPGDQPEDLGDRLAAKGLVGNLAGYWLWMDFDNFKPEVQTSPNFSIRRVSSREELDIWMQITEDGRDPAPMLRAGYLAYGFAAESCSQRFIGFDGDNPVTSATIVEAGGTMSIYDLHTPSQHRKRGYGGALMVALLEMIKGKGYQDTWIWSSPMAQTLYQQLGFVPADFGIREYPWHRASNG